MPEGTSLLAEAHAAYLDARGWALGASKRRVARRVHQLEHRHERGRLNDEGLAKLKGLRHGQAART